jgi:type IX secretion system PorP/SprF family membrane protein
MKKFSFILLLVCLVVFSHAQQRPHYTQYVLNNYVLNPALSGIENYTDVKISGRDQWVGLQGAPKTMYLTIHAPIGKKDYKTSATSYNVPGENPRGTAYWQNYTASEPHHGVGLSIINDQTGAYNRFNANVSYAYHLGISPRTNLAAGFSAGITRIGRNGAKDVFTNPGDPAQGSSGDLYRIKPDLNFGLWLYSADYFVGISGQQIIPQTVVFQNDTLGIKLIPHLFATAGYRFLVSEEVNAVPSVMVKYVSGSPTTPQFDINLKFQYKDLLWLGGGYRLQNGFSGMLGLNVGNTFNVGYAYDYTSNRLNTVSNGTHEFIVGFLLGNSYGDSCPRNVW